MSQYHSDPFQPPSLSPPVYGGDMPAQPTSWPTVIGIILIVMASLGILSNLCGAVTNVFLPIIMSAAPAEASDDPMFKMQMDLAQRFMPFQITNSLILLALGVLLLIAGIGMTKRRRGSVKQTQIWAVARILWAIPAAVATYFITMESIKMMEQSASGAAQMPPGFMGIMQMIGPISAVVGLLFWCAMPVFVLIWFARRRIKDEVATWP